MEVAYCLCKKTNLEYTASKAYKHTKLILSKDSLTAINHAEGRNGSM